ncbi:sugar ABC transporter permease [Nakamurella antarctica]|uniref:Sugar ABC transporter permease n=1 Tax=Nakamurella antarctica TaxID=1902245 RepID=A0A3G8ZP63_9ACTN|nr:sugar ABC transporter permease [Nakamurella antarctica]AZI58565.1 sugar ABC transporter permease [Nakamurella antarctica]
MTPPSDLLIKQRQPALASTTTGPVTPKRLTHRSKRDFFVFLAFALPNLALIAVFTYRPLLNNLYYSTLDWTLGSSTATSIGFDNYRKFFQSAESMETLKVTGIFTVATVFGSMAIGLLVALSLNRKVRGHSFARAAIFAPFVLSGVGVGLIWLFIFDPTIGVLSAVFRAWGSVSPQWFNDPNLALTMIIIVYVWKNLGYAAVIYLAALQSIPKDQLEAAELDGANGFKKFRYITLPLLSPTTFFLMLTTILSSLQAFDLIRIMTPTGSGTTTLMYSSYLQAFAGAYQRAGYSAAISVILFVLLLIMTIFQLRFLEKRVHYA